MIVIIFHFHNAGRNPTIGIVNGITQPLQRGLFTGELNFQRLVFAILLDNQRTFAVAITLNGFAVGDGCRGANRLRLRQLADADFINPGSGTGSGADG